MRYTLNGNPCNDAKISKRFEQVYDRYLQLHGIDPFNPVNTQDVIRQEFFERKISKELTSQKKSDLNHLVYNFRRKREFLQKRSSAIAKLFKESKKKLGEKIDELVTTEFNRSLLKNAELVKDSSRQLGKLLRKKELNHVKEAVANFNMRTSEKIKHNIHPYLQITEITEKFGDAARESKSDLEYHDLAGMFDSKA